MTHVIRLRGAWETKFHGGIAHHARNFGRPRTLDAGEQVWLVCAHLPGPGAVTLNGQVVGQVNESGPFAADVTGRLQVRNTVHFAVGSADPLGEVTIEIVG